MKKGLAMDTVTQSQEVEKLLTMTDNVVVCNEVYERSRNSGTEPRQYGRLKKSIGELARAANKVRKAGEKER
jgi:hypothetical protein